MGLATLTECEMSVCCVSTFIALMRNGATVTVNVLMVGSGEYTTGYVHGAAAKSDKGAGVVALTLFDLRRRGHIGRLLMAATNGTKFPGIRAHLQQQIGDRYQGMDVGFDSFPKDHVVADTSAYRDALDQLKPGDVVTVFTPDDSHFEIAISAVERGYHVLVAKPLVKSIDEHIKLTHAAEQHGVLVAMEVHKRWDPIYRDARDRIRSLGPCSYFNAYMSQPKTQLHTFSKWAGKSSDISYYLNAHHIDFHAWAIGREATPTIVHASASTGYAKQQGIETEDTITLTVTWRYPDGACATGVYTASWVAPPSDVHSQQRFFYAAHGGEITVDQAHRGYTVATNDQGFRSVNPLFMKYEPNAKGEFAGQDGYGYRSLAAFIEAANAIRAGHNTADDYHGQLATATDTLTVTAILEAGRRSLDSGKPQTISPDLRRIDSIK